MPLPVDRGIELVMETKRAAHAARESQRRADRVTVLDAYMTWSTPT
jgi:hypothetical protein